jgi:3-methyladenine DNA glycosylase AlkD
METILKEIRAELISESNEQERITGQRFFREEIRLYGMKASVIREIARKGWNRVNHLSKRDIFFICEELWKSGYFEESVIACEWSYSLKKKFEKDDFAVFEHWVAEYVSNWASCDTLCNHTIGEMVMKYPELLANLKQWTLSANRWMRRASAVTLIIPARKGMFIDDIFGIARLLLTDKDDMVQKGYGWMLKAASQAHQDRVFSFVMSNKKSMPRTALRYAIEKMPDELRKAAMEKP